MISLKMTEDTERLENRDECLEYLKPHKEDVGLTSHASGRYFFIPGIHTRESPIMRIRHPIHRSPFLTAGSITGW